MKKIFTFALAAMTALTMFAKTATVTLWEGTMTPEWNECKDAEKAVLDAIDADQLKAGDVLKLSGYRTDPFEGEGVYCKIAVLNGSWTSLIDGSTGDDRTCLAFNDSAKWAAGEIQSEEFEVTEETLPLFSGFIISGHGFNLTKIELLYEMENAVLFEGTMTPEWNECKDAEKAVLDAVASGAIAAGSEITLSGYRTDPFEGEGVYCKIAVLNDSWTSLIDGSTGDNRTDLAFNDSAKWAAGEIQSESFEVTEETLPLFSGFIISGHGFNLTKIEASVYRVSAKEEQEDLESATLWMAEEGWEDEDEPSNMIDNWGESIVNFGEQWQIDLFAAAYTRVAPMYIKVNNGVGEGKHCRISGNWGDWAETALPKDGYNHFMNMDEDGVIRVELNEDFINNVVNAEDYDGESGKGFTIWGAGYFFIEAIGTTKESVMNPVRPQEPEGFQNVELQKNGIRYNLFGQEVSKEYKGIVILNGKKMLQ